MANDWNSVGKQTPAQPWKLDKRNVLASVVSGMFFFSGWWIIIDAGCRYTSTEDLHHACHVCGIIGTLSFLMIISVSDIQLQGDYYTESCMEERGIRMWYFVCFFLSIGSLVAAAWILFQGYVIPSKQPMWPGIAVFLQNCFIFLGTFIFKFGRTEVPL